jgi:hypothetical protein
VTVDQHGEENKSVIQSSGDQSLTADSNNISLEQNGNQNDALLELSTLINSDSNIINLVQKGDGNAFDITVEGDSHNVTINQEGNDNLIIGTDSESLLIGGASTTFIVNQIGNDNIVEGNIISGLGSVDITQMGDYNTAVITQQ